MIGHTHPFKKGGSSSPFKKDGEDSGTPLPSGSVGPSFVPKKKQKRSSEKSPTMTEDEIKILAEQIIRQTGHTGPQLKH